MHNTIHTVVLSVWVVQRDTASRFVAHGVVTNKHKRASAILAHFTALPYIRCGEPTHSSQLNATLSAIIVCINIIGIGVVVVGVSGVSG